MSDRGTTSRGTIILHECRCEVCGEVIDTSIKTTSYDSMLCVIRAKLNTICAMSSDSMEDKNFPKGRLATIHAQALTAYEVIEALIGEIK